MQIPPDLEPDSKPTIRHVELEGKHVLAEEGGGEGCWIRASNVLPSEIWR